MSPALLPDLLRRQANQRPDVPALVSAKCPGLTYRAWCDRSSALGASLAELGVGSGDRVALIGGNSRYEDLGVAYMAILLAGAVVVPLSSSAPRNEVQHAIAATNPKLILTCDESFSPAPSWHVTSIERFAAQAPTAARLPLLSPDAPAEQISTSGTTGLPRVVEASHANLSRDFDVEPYLDPEPYYVIHALSPGTNVGQVALRSSLTLGYSVVALDAFDVDLYLDLAATLPMRETILLPAMAARLAADAQARGWSSDAVEAVVVTGAATPPETWRRLAEIFPTAQLINSYSTTEAWPARTVAIVDPGKPESVGRPLDNQAVEIRDEAGRRAAPFDLGTVHLLDRAVTPRRYVNGVPSVTHNGWVATDDLGYVDDEGFLFIVDRKSDVIATGGHTVSTLEVESVLAQHPDVVEAAVVGLPHPTLGSYVAACVIGPPTLKLEEVKRLARDQLAPHACPGVIERRGSLPRGRSGKVSKRTLREQLVAHQGRGRAQPYAEEQALIREIWEEVLDRSMPGVDLSFFALGGDSLSALRVVTRIHEELGDAVEPEALLAASTIAEQAALVIAAREQP